MTRVGTILDQIDAGTILLPEFQRGYVWNRDQVRGLMRSLYRDYPVGALLVWETEGDTYATRGDGRGAAGPKQLLLDGQQRVTTLYGLIRGEPPSFFEGDPSAFTNLRFNVETEAFEFFAPVKMKDDPLWIDVTRLFVDGPAAQYDTLFGLSWAREKIGVYVERLGRLHNVLQRDFHAERITGQDKTVDVVVDIFNRVNSGGTKLSKGDLALAKICAEWGGARPEMRTNLDRWQGLGYTFTLDWLLRNITAVATNRAPFGALEEVDAAHFEQSLHASVSHVDHFLQLATARLGLDHDRVLMGRYAIPVVSRLLHTRDGRFADRAEADRVLYWYVHAALRGRYAGSTETVLSKDLETAEKSGIDGLLRSLQRWRGGTLAIEPHDFEGLGKGSRFYPLLYLLTRTGDARDFGTGGPLSSGPGALHLHEIFPKAALYKHGYTRSEVNAVANFAFLTSGSSHVLGNRAPADYLVGCDRDALRSQWIPEDRGLWQLDRYREFLAARRELLASAANEYLDQLVSGAATWAPALAPVSVSDDDVVDAREAQVRTLVAELVELGFAAPALDAEIADPETGRPLAVAEAFWSDGLQVGQGSPVVLELDPEEADVARLTELGCEVFTSVDALRGYAIRRTEVASGDRQDEGGVLAPEPEVVDAAPSEVADGEFDRAVRQLVDRCRRELSYNPRYFRVMVTQHGALGAARRLLMAPAVSDGFVKLWEKQRLDLTVEALVTDRRFRHLFTDEEVEIAQRRLDDFGDQMSA